MEKEEKNKPNQEFKGRNLEDVISLAEMTLKLPRSQINYEIIAEKTKLFGIKTKEIVIHAWPKKKQEDHPASKFLDKVLSLFPLDIKYHVKKKDDMTYFIFEGLDKSFLLHKDGSLLLALQHLLNKVSPEKVQTDCDFYRKRKEQEIKEYAQEVARQVNESGENEVLDFMNPYERRIVHIAANQFPGITTESIGTGFLKRINVFLDKNKKAEN